jgi:hypothetical protein
MSLPRRRALGSCQRKRLAVRHFLADWNHWTIPERITAVTLAVGAFTIPAAMVAMV